MRTAAAATLLLLLTACASSPPAPPAARRAPTAIAPSGNVPAPPAAKDLDAIPDAVPRAEVRTLRGNPPFYEVLGQRYTVMASAAGYKERGVASWYGPNFHAKSTSLGDPYDMYAMSAAHKTLPLPAYVRVTNLSNNRSVVLRVNDRGPFVSNRIIDLSYTAAYKLDMLRAGTAFVEVEAIESGSLGSLAASVAQPAPPALAKQQRLYVQAGAFAVEDNAKRLAERLRSAGIGDVITRAPASNSRLWRVRIGPVADVSSYDQLVQRLTALSVEARLTTD
jgi:rare lipoprotein A